MVCSMTACAQYKIKSNWGSATWEIRSINQRYLESFFRLPDQLRSIEPILRKIICSYLTRGKVECSLHFEFLTNIEKDLVLNEKLVKQLIEIVNWIKIQIKEESGEINPFNILNWPGVLTIQENNLNSVTSEIISAFKDTIKDFILIRKKEGQIIKEIIEQRLENIITKVIKIRNYMPEILKWQRSRLVNKLKEAQIKLENDRLEQEIFLIAQKVDVNEELDRLEFHAKETFNILNKKEAIGRRLDFMMQELNREANTLASKSINTEVTNLAIELKVLIEQIREQAQNIE